MTARAALIKVQIARKELGLVDDDYRMILSRLTGETSAAACTEAQLDLVLGEFTAKGWKPKVVVSQPARQMGKTFAAGQRRADHPSAKKARALWLSLWHLGEVRDSSETALESFARRQLGVERLQWADQAQVYKLIEALKAMAERAGWSQDVAGFRPGTDLIKVLKSRLIRLQTSRLGHPGQCAEYVSWAHADLDRVIREQGEAIRCLPENAR